MRERQCIDGEGGASGCRQSVACGEKMLRTCYVRDGSVETPRVWICRPLCVGVSIAGS